MLKITFDTADTASGGFTAAMLDEAVPLATLVYEKQGLDNYGKQIDSAADGMLQKNIDAVGFKGKSLKSHLAVIPHAANFVLLIGGGDNISGKDALKEKQSRHIGATIGSALKHAEGKSVRLLCDASALSLALIAFGAVLNHYHFGKYLTKEEKKQPREIIISGKYASDAQKLFTERYLPLIEGVTLTRNLVSEPANILHPPAFADICAKLATDGLDVEVLDAQSLEKMGMGALLGVAQGSQHPARLVTMCWRGADTSSQMTAIVGKGVTFDTGGISIKPAAGMEEMKWDMGGAGVVAGLMQTLARRKARVNVVGIIGLVENMPSSTAMRPGDIVTSLSGQTIEVLNTDAEGRLVLADALWYAQEQFSPEIVIDLATLTGAMIITLGHEYAGIFSNDDMLADQLCKAGQKVDEKLWRLPLDNVYDKMLQSPIADMKNIGGRPAGSITAAQFLQRFIKPGVKWAHLDIAGVTWLNKARPTIPKGASGFAVQLLDNYLENFEK